jgi:hypothetical protein
MECKRQRKTVLAAEFLGKSQTTTIAGGAFIENRRVEKIGGKSGAAIALQLAHIQSDDIKLKKGEQGSEISNPAPRAFHYSP